ncbi:MAG: hypothetical protein D6805_01670, partial [Planctomycetota bacterium]
PHSQLLSHIPPLHIYTFSFEKCPQNFQDILTTLQNLPCVQYAEPNYTARIAFSPQDTYYNSYQKIPPALGLEQAWKLTQGSPQITIAVLDTGVDTNHEDLQANIQSPGYDFVQNDPFPDDRCGHGTAMAGIIAAKGNNQKGIAGAAWNCRILPVKIANKNGIATFDQLAKGIVFAVDQGAQILNISLGSLAPSTTLHQAVQYAYRKGAILIAAAGNDLTHQERYPAAYPEVLSVAALGPNGDLGYWTNLSPKTDLAAPGERVWTTVPGNLYAQVEGTSVATAYASAVAALVLSTNPNLTNTQVYEILRACGRPIPSLQHLQERFPFRALYAPEAIQRAKKQLPDLAITSLQLSQLTTKPSTPLRGYVKVRNQGLSTANTTLKIYHNQQPLLSIPIENLHTGQTRTYTFSLTSSPNPQQNTIEARLLPLPKEIHQSNNQKQILYHTSPNNLPNIRITDIQLPPTISTTNPLSLQATIANTGNTTENQIRVQAHLNQLPLGEQILSLNPGEKKQITFLWQPPSSPKERFCRFRIHIPPLPNETNQNDNHAGADFILADAHSPINAQYAQKGSVDLNADAPYAIIPGRTYVPIMLFIPDKGSGSSYSYLRLDRVEIRLKNNPNTPGKLIYQDTFGAPPTTVAPGTTIVDENGKLLGSPSQPNLNAFEDKVIRVRGKQNYFRFLRSSLQIPLHPPQMLEKYFSVDVSWSYHRHLFWNFYWIRRGKYHKTLKIHFYSQPLPTLPGEGKYFDVHFHTIAEWTFAPFYQILAPKKAWGGPIQMIKEAAYAWGLTNHINDIYNNIITTDHNCFFNETLVSNPNSPDYRPPVGPTSPAQNPTPTGGTYTEFEAYRRLFGKTAGEEVALSRLPLGAHMLLYQGQHFEGYWHGGSLLSLLFGLKELKVDDVMKTLAKQNRSSNQNAFAYAAHPFGSQNWSEEMLSKAMGLSPKYRNYNWVHTGKKEFVFKGLEFFNGRNDRNLPYSAVDFNNLNPFLNPQWQKGNPNWDSSLQKGLVRWHKYLSQLLQWSFQNTPNEKFIRKVYISAGTDAHGDFNYKDGRLATLLPFQRTYSASSNAWARVRTYVFSNGKPGNSPALRALKALEDGNSVVTDGPLLWVAMDANSRFNSQKLVWHDQQQLAEDNDGQIGGGGQGFDGKYTLLVEKNNPNVIFRYRYANSPDFGSQQGKITHIKIYKTEPGKPNPTRKRGSFEQIIGVGELQPAGANRLLQEPLNPQEEGTISQISAFAFGAFTGSDPDQTTPSVQEYRCFTNPIWAIPVKIQIHVGKIDTQAHLIPKGELKITLTFPLSMENTPLDLEIKALDSQGNSTDYTQPPLSRFQSLGWQSNSSGVKFSVYQATNSSPIPLQNAPYPQPNHYSFVIYTRQPIRDIHQNPLNNVAKKFTINYTNPNQAIVITSPITNTTPVSTSPTNPTNTAANLGKNSSNLLSNLFGCTLTKPHHPPTSLASLFSQLLPLLLLLTTLHLLRRKTKLSQNPKKT